MVQTHQKGSKSTKVKAFIQINLHENEETELNYEGITGYLVMAMGNAIIHDKQFETIVRKAIEIVDKKNAGEN